MVPPPRGMSSGLVSPDEEQDDVEDMASPRGSRDREDAALSFRQPQERERERVDQSGALTRSLGERQKNKRHINMEALQDVCDFLDAKRLTERISEQI